MKFPDYTKFSIVSHTYPSILDNKRIHPFRRYLKYSKRRKLRGNWKVELKEPMEIYRGIDTNSELCFEEQLLKEIGEFTM